MGSKLVGLGSVAGMLMALMIDSAPAEACGEPPNVKIKLSPHRKQVAARRMPKPRTLVDAGPRVTPPVNTSGSTRGKVLKAKTDDATSTEPVVHSPQVPRPDTHQVATAVANPEIGKPAVAALPSSKVELNEEVYFGLGDDNPSTKRALAKSVKWLAGHPDTEVVIEGHADPTGASDDNMTLSQARAEAVKEFLVASGIDASRIEVKAFGETKLKYGPRDGRNRRAEIHVKK